MDNLPIENYIRWKLSVICSFHPNIFYFPHANNNNNNNNKNNNNNNHSNKIDYDIVKNQ